MIVCSILTLLHNGKLHGNVPELSFYFDDGNLLLVRICFKLEGCLNAWRFRKYFIEALVFVQNVS